MMIDISLCRWSNSNPQVIHNGVLPLLCSAALFIRAGICPVQCLDTFMSIKPSPCLSLGAEPSCSRSPWVKLIRFSPSQPQTGALSTPGVRLSLGQQKSRLSSTLNRGTPVTPGLRVDLNGFICCPRRQRWGLYQSAWGLVKPLLQVGPLQSQQRTHTR
jgi:hypothetical protein